MSLPFSLKLGSAAISGCSNALCLALRSIPPAGCSLEESRANPHFSRKMRPKGRNRRSGLCQSGSSGLTPLITEKANCFLGDEILGRAEPALRAGSDAADIA
jgi:hypothetical protein